MLEIKKLREKNSKNLPSSLPNHIDINCSESNSEDEFLDMNEKRERRKFLKRHAGGKNIKTSKTSNW